MKPALSEIFSAIDGIIQAGVTLVKAGESTLHPLADLAVRASGLSHTAKTKLLQAEFLSAQTQSSVVRMCFDFLESAKTQHILREHRQVVLSTVYGRTGGQVQDVIDHIADMRVREKNFPEERIPTRLKYNGEFKEKFSAAYLPSFARQAKNEDAPLPPESIAQPAVSARPVLM